VLDTEALHGFRIELPHNDVERRTVGVELWDCWICVPIVARRPSTSIYILETLAPRSQILVWTDQ
jgi:hypothetical protein